MVEPITIQTVLTYLTLISVPIGVFYHIMILNNTRKTQQLQLETRQAQLLMQIFGKYTETELMKQQMDILNWDYNDVGEFWERYGPFTNPNAYTSFARLAYFFDGIGVLLKRGLIDKVALYDLMGVHVLQYWNLVYYPLMDGLRERWENPNAYQMFEHLANEFAEMNIGLNT